MALAISYTKAGPRDSINTISHQRSGGIQIRHFIINVLMLIRMGFSKTECFQNAL